MEMGAPERSIRPLAVEAVLVKWQERDLSALQMLTL
jgi:hypothetical protein